MRRSRNPTFAPGLAGRLVLDSGAITKIAGQADPLARALWRELTLRGWTTCIPAVTLAEILTGRPRSDAAVNLLLKQVDALVDCDEPTARLAGILRAGARISPRPSGIDAIVAAVASATQPSIVLTTDPADLRALLHDAPEAEIVAV